MEPCPLSSTLRGDAAAPPGGEAGLRITGVADDGVRDATRSTASGCAVLASDDPAGSPAPDPLDPPAPDPLAPPAPDPLAPPASGERWWVLQTRSRCEKKVARACARLGIRHYLPLRPPRRRRGAGLRGRRGGLGGLGGAADVGPRPARSDPRVPLFPGYVFVCCAPSLRDLVLESGSIARMIAVLYPAPLLAELEQVRAALAAGVDLAAGPALARGMCVRVASGLLGGIVGRVAGVRRDRVRLVLNVTLLGRGAEVEVDADTVVPVEEMAGWLAGGPAEGPAGGTAADGASAHGDGSSGAYGGRRPWRVRRGRAIGQSVVGAV